MPSHRSTSLFKTTGFTLVELLVVIGLIGVLIAATLTIVPKVKRAVYGAQTSAQMAKIATAIQQYYNDFRAYPGPLPNNQICAGFDSSPTPFSPYATPNALTGTSKNLFTNNDYNPGTNFKPNAITNAQNLVLGLLGGLEIQQTSTTPTYAFVYDPSNIFSDGISPAPKGPSSLNPNQPKRYAAYMQVTKGELSIPNATYNSGNGGSFADEAGRTATDSMIPVFLDQFSNPMPILYYRTNVGGTAIAGFRNSASSSGTPQLTYTDTNGNTTTLTAQYDLFQNLPYTKSQIGTIAKYNSTTSFHGLQGLGANDLSDPIDKANPDGSISPTSNSGVGSNGLAYFKDPSLNVAGTSTNVYQGVARQKDGFVLISAGPDRLYGTRDDVIYPGPLVPAN